MDIQCQICKSTFLKTTRAPAYAYPPLMNIQSFLPTDCPTNRLTEHATNKHSKTLPECFPTFEIQA